MSAFTHDTAGQLAGPDWMRDRRAAALERFDDTGLPTEAEEIWRYSRISELDLDRYSPVQGPAESGVPADAVDGIDAIGPRAALLVTRNGRVAHVELDEDVARRGAEVGDVLAAPDGDDLFGAVAASSTDAFTELATAFVTGGALVRIPAGVTVEQPIVVVHWVDADGSAVFPRTVVVLGEDAEATVIERYQSPDVAAFVDPVVELDVGDAGRLTYASVQDLGPRVWQTAYQASRVGRDSQLTSTAVALGGDYARLRTDARLEGKGGSSRLMAVYFGPGSGMHDFRTLQDHAAPQTTSDLLFKGAVAGTAKGVYSGLIRVRKEAPGTNAFQTNRNLVLSEGAGAESVPNLEIETNDVHCSHASAVGPIDEEQRYYLESRGIPPDIAERLIVLGFFGEVLERLPSPSLAARLRERLAERLGGGA
ncbi:MAG TPA: Fe-S cluster assembly protein SufD [Acidimicrobiales bacterium]|jgi:Fe-S cluster assembly protein SufD|nr:Fe-S cluster assembly protein SufD [Acidimicrobiales bacterium]